MIALNGLLGKAVGKGFARATGLCLTSRGLAAAQLRHRLWVDKAFHAPDPSGAQALQGPLDPVDAA